MPASALRAPVDLDFSAKDFVPLHDDATGTKWTNGRSFLQLPAKVKFVLAAC